MAFHAEQRGPVLVLTIDRPEKRNSLDGEVLDGIGAGMARADSDPEIRVVVLTAVGDKAFCAGMDLGGFARGDSRQASHMADFTRWQRKGISKPVIAAVNGTAVAGGFELVLACDLVVASDQAKFGLPEVKRGLLPAGGGFLLGRRVPPAVASELCLLGDMFGAQRAYELGLVNRVVAADKVMEEAFVLADGIVANAPLSVSALQRLVRVVPDLDLDAAWELFATIQPGVFASEDAKEGATAFVEKRPAQWKGR
ncbi:MAG: enoyl-CoA hydratase-related protein [Acidimicrobiia bacterium]